eukprot:CAMPEP_0201517644 /NCGR_PEP_ID=MMETSP0161_2-20130828/8693_1 /ASSEMBLY_ACC=CAM_ASM_000251 /TAXON_ID=180227 /ORGANISM="Neoparamoeba aestuarina, Strain SoJaBio B1-5/56/2" /LENGTH=506 /DNA_ID=CAMNT_0047915201 /DNA_START=344 /DNA_END=1865 /DNA_ORIENTATION=+
MTQEECQNYTQRGRYGCVFPGDYKAMSWHFAEECTCIGGIPSLAWDWEEGVWSTPQSRPLTWTQSEYANRLVYDHKALDFFALEKWIQVAREEYFLYSVQSQILCETNLANLPLKTVTCDCGVANDSPRDYSCYEDIDKNKLTHVGVKSICGGKGDIIKSPSGIATFGPFSVRGCTIVDIFTIYQTWFAAPFVPPPLSFRWQETRDIGVVRNNNGATVGELLGSGSAFKFRNRNNLIDFTVCLRVLKEPKTYKIPDIGYAKGSLEYILPLGKKIDVEDDKFCYEDDNLCFNYGKWWCARGLDATELPFSESDEDLSAIIRLFPIARQENYEEEDESYVSHSTKSLCYTLGALYCFLGFLYLLSLYGVMDAKSLTNLRTVCSVAFVIVCVFRASFMFLYPTGTFEFEPLSYFVVFEIPTFVLFSLLIYMIYTFKRLVYKKGFFPDNPTPILIIGWTFVWSLWLVVTIVYSEVILELAETEEDCEGRVEISYDDEEDALESSLLHTNL